MRKILPALALVLCAAACGTSPTGVARPAQASLDAAPVDEVCTKYAMAGGHRTCEAAPPAIP